MTASELRQAERQTTSSNPQTRTCRGCGTPVPYAGHGRPQVWCDENGCRADRDRLRRAEVRRGLDEAREAADKARADALVAASALTARGDGDVAGMLARALEPLLRAAEDRIVDRVTQSVAGQAPPSPWLTRDEAVRYTRLGLRSFQKRVSEGHIPSHKLGGTMLFLREELDAAIRRGDHPTDAS